MFPACPPRPAPASVHDCEPTELNEAGFVRVEAEAEGGQPLPNVAKVLLRIPLVLEPDHNIVGVTDDGRFAVRGIRAPFLVEPQVERVMQEHVRQDGGSSCYETARTDSPPNRNRFRLSDFARSVEANMGGN